MHSVCPAHFKHDDLSKIIIFCEENKHEYPNGVVFSVCKRRGN
jgi:hypothetical protein